MTVKIPCEADERDLLVYNLQLNNLGLPEQDTARKAIDSLEDYVQNKSKESQ
jgi:hypothetical protein